MSWYSIVRRGGTTATPWTPSQMSSLLSQYDADAETLADNAAVPTLTDRASSYDMSGTATFKTGILNGKGVYRYNGTSDGHSIGANNMLDAASGFWMFAVASKNDPLVNSYLYTYLNPFDQTPDPAFRTKNGVIRAFSQASPNSFAGLATTQGFTASSFSVVGIFCDGTNLHARLDGVSYTTAFSGGALIAGQSPGTSIGFEVRANLPGALRWDGDIAEVVIGTSNIPLSDAEQLEGYLAHKWGITANLPAGHPYKNSAPLVIAASGGTETTPGDGYKYHTFTSSSTFNVSGAGAAEVLIVAGGGGGGTTVSGGGGGAGGVLVFEGQSALAFDVGQYTITVGNGGAGGISAGNNGNQPGTNGQNSSVVGGTINYSAVGGGGGAAENGAAGIGGSGGGGSGNWIKVPSNGAAGTSGQGNAGGNAFGTSGTRNSTDNGGGGGGAGGAGGNATSSAAGDGGVGLQVWGAYYGGGGGGASFSATKGVGGLGGGGNGGGGGWTGTLGQNGTANTGGGGGGGDSETSGAVGGTGGSGIVIIRYAI